MDNSSHIFKRFDKEFNDISDLVVEMGNFSVAQLKAAIDSLKARDAVIAKKIIKADEKLNDLDVQADEAIVRFIARRQPMAGDLRKIIALNRIVSEFERAGDEARKIAKLCILFYKKNNELINGHILDSIYSLAEHVVNMQKKAIVSFQKIDLTLAHEVLKSKEKVEEMLQISLRSLSTFIMEDYKNISHFVDIVLGLRALERYGGHASNVVEHVIFIKTGFDVRHSDIEEIERKILPDLPEKK